MSDTNGRLRTLLQCLTLIGIFALGVSQFTLGEKITAFIEEQAVADSLESTVTHDGQPVKVVTFRRQVSGAWESDETLEERHFGRCSRLAD